MTTTRDINTVMAFTYLHKFIDILGGYFEEVNEESVRDNFVIIYELLDETMDNGYPQFTDEKILKEYIRSDYHKLTSKQKKNIKVPENISSSVSCRQPGKKYKKNLCYMDVIEKLNMTVNEEGNVVKAEVLGSLMMNTQLSGMPLLKLGLNDKKLFEMRGKSTLNTVEFEDIKFH